MNFAPSDYECASHDCRFPHCKCPKRATTADMAATFARAVGWDDVAVSSTGRTQDMAAVVLTSPAALTEEVERLRAALAWQPIETAPQDGTYVLVSAPGRGGSWVAHYEPVAVSGYRFEQPWRSVMLNHWHLPKDTAYLAPTLWMPLPAAPGAAVDAAIAAATTPTPEAK